MDDYDSMGPVEFDMNAELDYQDYMMGLSSHTRVSMMNDFVGGWD